ncbi:MAG: hypothetical protein RLO51_29240 [Thalassobaculum sp.]|uniref:hypothetical protein n=1 Tax=Thalassobaculum sp. TaxID=2022740 RepID=UPI0032EE321C
MTDITPSGGSLGATVHGADLPRALADADLEHRHMRRRRVTADRIFEHPLAGTA